MDSREAVVPGTTEETLPMRAVLTALPLTVLLLPPFLRADEPEKKADTKPPYLRLLQGDDARKAAELEKRIAELEAAGRYNEAIRAAEELLAFRQEAQGKDHWQALDASWIVETLRTLSVMPRAVRP
jgi:hypothetical protein